MKFLRVYVQDTQAPFRPRVHLVSAFHYRRIPPLPATLAPNSVKDWIISLAVLGCPKAPPKLSLIVRFLEHGLLAILPDSRRPRHPGDRMTIVVATILIYQSASCRPASRAARGCVADLGNVNAESFKHRRARVCYKGGPVCSSGLGTQKSEACIAIGLNLMEKKLLEKKFDRGLR